MENEMQGQALKAHAELVVLRLLVEAVVMTLPLEEQTLALLRYSKACERLIADVLGDAPREELVTVIERARDWQAARLANLGLEVPDPHG